MIFVFISCAPSRRSKKKMDVRERRRNGKKAVLQLATAPLTEQPAAAKPGFGLMPAYGVILSPTAKYSVPEDLFDAAFAQPGELKCVRLSI